MAVHQATKPRTTVVGSLATANGRLLGDQEQSIAVNVLRTPMGLLLLEPDVSGEILCGCVEKD